MDKTMQGVYTEVFKAAELKNDLFILCSNLSFTVFYPVPLWKYTPLFVDISFIVVNKIKNKITRKQDITYYMDTRLS